MAFCFESIRLSPNYIDEVGSVGLEALKDDETTFALKKSVFRGAVNGFDAHRAWTGLT